MASKTSDSEAIRKAGAALELKKLPGEDEYQRFTKFAPQVMLIQRRLMELHAFQCLIARAHFAVPELLVLIPKANTKTTLTAQLGDFHVLTTYYPEAYIGASDRGQAKKLYKESTRVIGQKKAWDDRVASVIESRKQVLMADGGWLDVLASDRLDKGSLEGIAPSWGGIDELHAHINDAIYRAIHGGLEKRPGRMITISTAGANPEGPLGLMRKAAHSMPVVERFGALTVATDRENFAMIEWSCDPTADLEDIKGVVKPANPFVTVDSLRKLRVSPSMTDSAWARYHCNVWRESDHAWLQAGSWQACTSEGIAPDRGSMIWVGVNLTPKTSVKHAAIVIGWLEDGVPRFTSRIFHPDDSGTVRHETLKKELRELHRTYQIVECKYDQKQLYDAAMDLGNDGLPMEPIAMTPAVWVPLTDDLMEAINTASIEHDGDEEFAAHVVAGELKDTPTGQHLTGLTGGRVEALIALGMAFRALRDEASRPRPMIHMLG